MRQLISGRHFGTGQFRSKGIGGSIRLQRSEVCHRFQMHGQPFDSDRRRLSFPAIVHGRVRFVSPARTWMSLSSQAVPVERDRRFDQASAVRRSRSLPDAWPTLRKRSTSFSLCDSSYPRVRSTMIDVAFRFRPSSTVEFAWLHRLAPGSHFRAGQFWSKGIGGSTRLQRSGVHGHFQAHSQPFDSLISAEIIIGSDRLKRINICRAFTVTSRHMANPSTMIDVAFCFRPSSTVEFVSFHRLVLGRRFRVGQLQSIEWLGRFDQASTVGRSRSLPDARPTLRKRSTLFSPCAGSYPGVTLESGSSSRSNGLGGSTRLQRSEVCDHFQTHGQPFDSDRRRQLCWSKSTVEFASFHRLAPGCRYRAGKFQSKGIGSSTRLQRSNVHGHFQTHG